MTETWAERIAGMLGVVVSVIYVMQARTIEDSLLADAVGASGVPVAVGTLMFLASVGLLIKTFIKRKTIAAVSEASAAEPDGAAPPDPRAARAESGSRGHWLAAGLLLILVCYTLFLPFGGYLLSVVLLLAASAWFGGARGAVTLGLTAAVGGLVLWFLFSFALKVGMPPGVLPRLLGF